MKAATMREERSVVRQGGQNNRAREYEEAAVTDMVDKALKSKKATYVCFLSLKKKKHAMEPSPPLPSLTLPSLSPPPPPPPPFPLVSTQECFTSVPGVVRASQGIAFSAFHHHHSTNQRRVERCLLQASTKMVVRIDEQTACQKFFTHVEILKYIYMQDVKNIQIDVISKKTKIKGK